MSWFNLLLARFSQTIRSAGLSQTMRSAGRSAAVFGLACMLSACFRPMYATPPAASTSPVLQQLAGVEVAPVSSRVEQAVRNELIYSLGSRAGHVASHQLRVTVRETLVGLLVQPDRSATGKAVVLKSNYVLTDRNNDIVHSGQVEARASYHQSAALFANERAKLDAENRAARQVAEVIHSRLAAFFASPPPAKSAKSAGDL